MNPSPEELAALVVKRSADVPAADRIHLKRAFSAAVTKAGDDADENTLVVSASTMGTADDRCGDVIFPGAYAKAIPGFLKNGFVALGHSWDDLPVAMPLSCQEDGNDLVCSAKFHSTPEAQNARTVCKERMDAGLSVSVSVGFMPDYSDEDGVVWFDKGSDLLAWAKGKGYDMKGFDVGAIGKLKYCRAITKIAELFEWSIVGVGCNRGAKGVSVKGFQKSLATTVAAILQAKIHQSFTVAADELAIRGYMDTDERIALSGAISTGLKAFAAAIDPEVGERSIEPTDVDWVASKSARAAEGQTFDDEFSGALDGLLSLAARWNGIAEKRDRLGETHRAKLTSLLDALDSIAAKSEAAPDAAPEDATPDPADEAAIKSRQRDLLRRIDVAVALAA